MSKINLLEVPDLHCAKDMEASEFIKTVPPEIIRGAKLYRQQQHKQAWFAGDPHNHSQVSWDKSPDFMKAHFVKMYCIAVKVVQYMQDNPEAPAKPKAERPKLRRIKR